MHECYCLNFSNNKMYFQFLLLKDWFAILHNSREHLGSLISFFFLAKGLAYIDITG